MEDLTMKLEDVKQKINSYLDGISPEDLLKKFTEQYGMSEYGRPAFLVRADVYAECLCMIIR